MITSSHLALSMALWVVVSLLGAITFGTLAAISTLTHYDVDALKNKGSRAAKSILNLVTDDFNRILGGSIIATSTLAIVAALLLNNIIDLTITTNGYMAIGFIIKLITISTIVALLIFHTPRKLVSMNRQRFLLSTIFISRSVLFITKPITLLFKSKHKELPRELEDKESEKKNKILSGILRFGATEVSAIMRHRTDVVAIELGESFASVKDLIAKSGYSRIPVYGKDIDDIKGMLYIKDMLENLHKDEFEWESIVRKPLFVPATKRISDLLEEFQLRHIHFAIVVDEYGATLGIVSLEDILEEIVGEISDESDAEERLYREVGEGVYIFNGKIHITDFLRIFEKDEQLFDDISGEAETIAGLLLEVKRDFLSVDDKLTIGEFTFVVKELEGRRISKIEVTIK